MRFLYYIALQLYGFVIRLAALRNEKAKAWVDGRENWREKLPHKKTSTRYWFHCASLGEFEQARPLVDYYHNQGIEICLSFYSPSGYEIRKDYDLASWVGYLPIDSPKNAKDFVSAMDADRVFFVKYEFWYFFLMEIKRRNVPFYLISARFRSSQPFFRPFGTLHRKMLKAYTYIFTQDKASMELLAPFNLPAMHAGDTRFDRVAQLKERRKEIPELDAFCNDSFVVMAGSSWPYEEELIRDVYSDFPYFKWVIVPHETDEEHCQEIEALFRGECLRYSELEKGNHDPFKRVLIIDRMGLLGNAYPYADLALVGGGFSNALHNILEAAVWGVAVCYGNNIAKYPEGIDLAEAGGGFLLAEVEEFRQLLNRFAAPNDSQEAGKRAAQWVENNRGASKKIIEVVAANAD